MLPYDNSSAAQDFEQLLQDAIIAVKGGNRSLAKRLLNQASLLNNQDARTWIWLSATTDDLHERQDYLEQAVAAEPSNATAKRGLLIVRQQIATASPAPASATAPAEPSQPAVGTTPAAPAPLMPEGAFLPVEPNPQPVEAVGKAYLCRNCGAVLTYEIPKEDLVCQFCGFIQKVQETPAGAEKEQVLDVALPTSMAHEWAKSQSRVTCEQCAAVILLPPGQTADSCPYCGSNRFITSTELADLFDPQVIGLFKYDPQKAGSSIKSWLSKGLFAPDDLAAQHAGMLLHPAYYPFWIFSGTLEIPWFCDVNLGSGQMAAWEARNGSHFEMFKDVLVTGNKRLSTLDVRGIEPFSLSDLLEFSPDYLAGWVALTYDHPLADASLQAREKVIRTVLPKLPGMVETQHPKRRFSTGPGKWSGLSYKLALLPIYVGNYIFQGKRYRLLVNGQTGKVAGKKPVDSVKTALLSVAGLILLSILTVIIWMALRFLVR